MNLSDTVVDSGNSSMVTPGLMEKNPYLTTFILILYGVIFVIGIFGNVLVLYIVIRNKPMQTITNKFIACLSVSDVLICLCAIPFTPTNALMKSWIFGVTLCKLVPVILLISVFVSTLTSVVIALDRYMAVVHPHAPRMSPRIQLAIIIIIWVLASSAAVPIGIVSSLDQSSLMVYDCQEKWPNSTSGTVYSWIIFNLQMIIPAVIITVCYATISVKLNRRRKKRFGNNHGDAKKEQQDIKRNRRINKMLIAMIAIFILCWLPLDIVYTTMDLILKQIPGEQFITIFLFVHIIAMSSVIYNPFLYGWMNESFNKHYRQLWNKTFSCCCKNKSQVVHSSERNNSSNSSRNGKLNGHTSPMQGSPSTSVLELRTPELQEESQPFLKPNNEYGNYLSPGHQTIADEQV